MIGRAGVDIENVSCMTPISGGALSSESWDSICVQNLTTLASAVPEIGLQASKLKICHVTLTTPVSGGGLSSES